jgi:DNA invertase Pin-like site-specific DNA recombinase
MRSKTPNTNGHTATKAVGYIRCSTPRQGQSGLGLEAQQAAITHFCRSNGYELLQEFREVESGRNNERPILRRAIARAKAARGLLVIAKLDRLARSVAFIANLMESGVEFRACDYPDKDPFMLHIRAAVAEEEARKISTRTRDALAAYKARGGVLGAAHPAGHRITSQEARKGAERTATIAREANAEATAIATDLHRQGYSLRAIAAELDARGIATRSGGGWSAMQVSRLLRRAA